MLQYAASYDDFVYEMSDPCCKIIGCIVTDSCIVAFDIIKYFFSLTYADKPPEFQKHIYMYYLFMHIMFAIQQVSVWQNGWREH